MLGGSKLNEFIFQYADFANNISANSQRSVRRSSRTASPIGQNPNTPQTTEQKKWQFRDDFSWHITGKGGVGHDFKAGVNFINEPRLFITFNTGKSDYAYTHLDRRPERADLDRDAQRRRRPSQHPAEAVRLLRPGRLARSPTG